MRITPRQGLKTKQGKESRLLALFVNSCVTRQPIRLIYLTCVDRMMPGGGLEPPTRGFSALLRITKMVDFNRTTDMPPAINTLEKYAAHALLTLNNLFAGLTYQELPGALLERVCDLNIVTAADGTIRLIARVSIPLAPDYATSDGKLWTKALEFNEATIPAAYKVD